MKKITSRFKTSGSEDSQLPTSQLKGSQPISSQSGVLQSMISWSVASQSASSQLITSRDRVQLKTLIVWLMTALVFTILIMFCTSPAYADNLSDVYVQDNYGVMTSNERSAYEEQADQIAKENNCGVYYVTVPNIGSQSVREYAESYYKKYGLGLGSNTDGIMFLVAVDSRDYVTITHGSGIQVFSDYAIAQLEEKVLPDLKSNKFSSACGTYLQTAKDTFVFYSEKGTALEKSNDPNIDRRGPIVKALLLALVVALFVSFLMLRKKQNQMKTAREKTEASDYFDFSQTEITESDDNFKHTTRIVVDLRQKEDNHSGGGSTVSSSGFGGSSGGKF